MQLIFIPKLPGTMDSEEERVRQQIKYRHISLFGKKLKVFLIRS